MARDRNYLLGQGENLTTPLDPPGGGGNKSHAYSFEENREHLLPKISQAAQETQKPASIIPRTSIGLILTSLVYAIAYANLALGMTPAHPVPLDAGGHVQTFFQFLGSTENQGSAVAAASCRSDVASQRGYWAGWDGAPSADTRAKAASRRHPGGSSERSPRKVYRGGTRM